MKFWLWARANNRVNYTRGLPRNCLIGRDGLCVRSNIIELRILCTSFGAGAVSDGHFIQKGQTL